MTGNQLHTGRTTLDLATDESPEQHFRIADLPDAIPGRPSVQAIWRWILTGILDSGGERIRLASTKIGGRRVVSRVNLDEFIARLNSGDETRRRQDGPKASTPDGSRAQQAGHALDAMGCGHRKKGRGQ